MRLKIIIFYEYSSQKYSNDKAKRYWLRAECGPMAEHVLSMKEALFSNPSAHMTACTHTHKHTNLSSEHNFMQLVNHRGYLMDPVGHSPTW